MRVLFLTNNEISYPLVDFLKKCGEYVIIFDDKLNVSIIEYYKPDFIISYNYQHLIKDDVLQMLPGKCINLHISYLPWNKGADPNIWSFLEHTPQGVTIHLIDKGLDTGDILFQQELNFDIEEETLASTYDRLHLEIQTLFKNIWGKIKDGEIKPKQQAGKGSFHNKKDLKSVRDILFVDEDWNIPIKKLLVRYNSLRK